MADATAVLNALPRDLVGRFEREGWMLVRNYNDEIGSSYAEAFGTADPAAVEHYCRDNGIEFEWQPGGGLRTRQRRAAIARHPVTGHFSWFNQIAFLNEWTLEPDVREFLVDTYGGDGLPFNTRFGSGAPVGPEIVQLLNERLRGAHAPRAVAAGRPAAGGQHPLRARPRALRRAARGARRDDRAGATAASPLRPREARDDPPCRRRSR